MEVALEWARGPLFRASFAIMVLGLARVLLLNLTSLATLVHGSHSTGRHVPLGPVARATLRWLVPVRRAFDHRALFSLTSLLFHVSIIVTPIWLAAHIQLWERGLGVRWPALGGTVADYLTLLAIASGLALFAQRVGIGASRAISRAQDVLLPLVIVVPFASGYLAMHPALNPFGYDATMLVHVLSGNLVLVLVPFSKISHVVLFPTTRLIAELGWHLSPGAGERVAVALGKEGEAI